MNAVSHSCPATVNQLLEPLLESLVNQPRTLLLAMMSGLDGQVAPTESSFLSSIMGIDGAKTKRFLLMNKQGTEVLQVLMAWLDERFDEVRSESPIHKLELTTRSHLIAESRPMFVTRLGVWQMAQLGWEQCFH